jgi:Tetratricopeptide repeat
MNTPDAALVRGENLRYPEMVRRVSLLLGVTVFSFALHGSAQNKSGGNRAAAEALFNQGRSLMSAGKFAEACPKFEASQQLDPGLGTMLNLAECYEKTGRTASAWAEYREAIPLARASGSKARQDLALERAQALEERLSTLTIRAMSGDPSDAQLEVRRDGVALQPAELGSPIPVDPGEHVIEASAPGRELWSSKVQVGGDAAKVTIEIPKLKSSSTTTPPTTTPPMTTSPVITTTTNAPPSDRPRPDGSTQRVSGLVLGGAGIVGVGLGTFFGLRASSKWSDAKGKCSDYPFGCGTDAMGDRSSARSAGTVSTIGFVSGAALLATGIVLYLTAPSKKESVAVNIGPQSLRIQGGF